MPQALGSNPERQYKFSRENHPYSVTVSWPSESEEMA